MFADSRIKNLISVQQPTLIVSGAGRSVLVPGTQSWTLNPGAMTQKKNHPKEDQRNEE
ncbi:MAG TPA: hypothetical protein VK914_04520 [bacterium]|nr:hypothetical protein [bacterium]